MGVEFKIDLTGNVASAATSAAKALGSNANAAKILKGEMASLEARIVKAAAIGDAKGLPKLQKDLELVRRSFGQLSPALQQAAMAEQNLSSATDRADHSLKAEFADVAKNCTSLSGLKGQALAAAGAYGSLAAAALTVATGFVAATGGMVVAGIELAIEATVVREKLLAMFGAMSGGGRSGGEAVVRMLTDLSDRLGVTRASLVDTTKALMAIGITDLSALRSQIQATASISAVMGEQGSAAYEKILAKTQEALDTGAKFTVPDKQIAQWRLMGFGITDIAKRMGTTAHALELGLKRGLDANDVKRFQNALGEVARSKFGHALAEQALEPASQWAKLKESIGMIFSGVDARPLLVALHQAIGVFSGDKASGKAMRAGVAASFTSVVQMATRFVQSMTGLFLRVEIAALKAALWAKPWYEAFAKFDASYGVLSKIALAAEWLAAAFGLIAATVTALIIGPFLVLAAVGAGVVAVLTKIATWGYHVAEALAGMASAAYDAAKNFVSGLVGGIIDGAGAVVHAAGSLAARAVDAVKGVFQSHSPSLVMRGIGHVGVAGGLALGMATGIPQVRHSASMVAGAVIDTVGGQVAQASNEPRPVAPSFAGPSMNSSSSRTVTVHVAPGAIIVNGAGKSGQEISEEMIASLFERIALEQGT